MRKTFCDRCEKHCRNFSARISATIEHETSQGEQVGYDQTRPLDLCSECYGLAKDLLGLVEIPHEAMMAVDAPPLPY